MRVVCAWCQQEGKPAVMREDDSADSKLDSHGICDAHSVKLLHEIRGHLLQALPLSLSCRVATAAAVSEGG